MEIISLNGMIFILITQKHLHQAQNCLLDLLFFPIKIFMKGNL